MICPSCGSWVDEGDMICPSCGSEVGGEDSFSSNGDEFFSYDGEYECTCCHERFYVDDTDDECPFCGAPIKRPEFY